MAQVTRPRVENVLPRDLVEWAREGRIRLPSFQRSYRWERGDVTALFDSILRGYPIGNLLVWQRPAAAAKVTVGHLTVSAPKSDSAYWVVDGQQRITSLVGALTADETTVDPRFRIYFDVREGRFESLPSSRRPEMDWLPVALTLNTAAANAWVRDRPHLDRAEISRVDEVVAAIRDYAIPVYVVSGHDEHVLREIFDRLNTFGKRLKSSEIFSALHAASEDHEPNDLKSLVAAVGSLGFGEIPPQMITQSMLAIRNPKVDRDFRREFTDEQDLATAFALTERTLGLVIGFLREYAAIPHVKLLPYALYVPILARFIALFGPPRDRAADLLRRWIWRGAVLGVAPQGNTVALRKSAGAVHDDPDESAERLLELLPVTGDPPWTPDLSQTRLNSAHGKVNVLGLLSAGPRAFPLADSDRPGPRIKVAKILNRPDPPSMLVPVTHLVAQEGESLAGRLLAPGVKPETVRNHLLTIDLDEGFLAGHCLDREAVRLLREGRENEFIGHRAHAMRALIAAHVQELALFGFRDGPSMSELFSDAEVTSA